MPQPGSRGTSLPARPHLGYLKKLAKTRLASLRVDHPNLRLAEAQLTLAREYGFPSWRALKKHVDSLRARAMAENLLAVDASVLDQFLDAAVPQPDSDHKSGSLEPALQLLKTHPDLTHYSIYAACVVGDEQAVASFLKKDPSLAVTPGGIRGWVPLCYLTFSRFLRDQRKQPRRFIACAKSLLRAGADPNSYWAGPNDLTSREAALYGAAGIANCAPLAKLLLNAGADVNDHESLYHAAEFGDNAALCVLLEAKPQQKWVSYNLCHKMDMEDPAGVKLFIKHGADVNVLLTRGMFKGIRPLHFAIFRRRSLKIFRLLLDAGADPNLTDQQGVSPYVLARKLGLNSIARLLKSRGAHHDLDDHTRLLAALSSGDRRTASRLLRLRPDLRKQLSERDHKLLVDAAESGNVKAVALMLDLGFPINTRGTSYGGWDGTALHYAAFDGHADVVRLLLERGADPDDRNGFGGDALGTAIYGTESGEHKRGDDAADVLRDWKNRGLSIEAPAD